MNINTVIEKFYKIIEIASNINLIRTDLKIVAIKELQLDLSSIEYTQDNYNNLDDSLSLLKNRGFIFDYEKIENGFKIIPQNKVYYNENDLIVTFDEK